MVVVSKRKNKMNAENSTMEIDQQNEDLNNWLPVTASREAKWWYSAFHNVTAMVGAGVLGLPFAISQLGWYNLFSITIISNRFSEFYFLFTSCWTCRCRVYGVGAILGSWVITFYTLWQLVELHEAVPGRRFDRYSELGEHAFGPRLGYWIVMPQQMLVQVGTDIVYNVTGGTSLKKAIELLIPSFAMRNTYYILIFTAIQLGLSQIPNFNSLKGVSLLAAVMSVCYSMIAFVASTVKGTHQEPSSYGIRSHDSVDIAFDAMNALGTIAFAFAGHSVVLEIQATIPSTPEVPSKKPTWKGVVVAYAIVLLCYLAVATAGFWAFGNLVEDNILVSLQKPSWLIAVANFMVFLHVVGSYQVHYYNYNPLEII